MSSSVVLTFLLALCLATVSSSQKCTVVKDAAYYLSLSIPDFLAESTQGVRIGGCYIVPKAASGACDMYAKSAVVGSDGDRGWPKTSTNRGTGCVRAPNLPRGITTCFYNSPSYDLTNDLVSSFCTDDGSQNAVAMIKHAIRNSACKVPTAPPPVSCVSGSPGCSCQSEESECPVRGSPVTVSSTIKLERVRRCRNKIFFCNSVIENPDYNVFESNGMPKRAQKKLYITQINKPSKQATKNIVFVVAGQQFRSGLLALDGDSSGVTGQFSGYTKGFRRKTGSLTKTIDTNSLLYRILDQGYLSLDDTFVGAVFDARFNFEFSKKNKNRIENAYYEYLLQKLSPAIGTIYLAGHSRGGCLVMRLASRLTQKFPNVRIIVHNYDGVCANGALLRSSEFGAGDPTHTNPLNSDYYVYTTEMEQRFVNRNCLSIRSFLSGEQPIDAAFKGVRAFGHRGFASSTSANSILTTSTTNFPWYTETFYNARHNSIDDLNHSIAADHFRAAMDGLPCTCGL